MVIYFKMCCFVNTIFSFRFCINIFRNFNSTRYLYNLSKCCSLGKAVYFFFRILHKNISIWINSFSSPLADTFCKHLFITKETGTRILFIVVVVTEFAEIIVKDKRSIHKATAVIEIRQQLRGKNRDQKFIATFRE